jgi:hypothetical protein
MAFFELLRVNKSVVDFVHLLGEQRQLLRYFKLPFAACVTSAFLIEHRVVPQCRGY